MNLSDKKASSWVANYSRVLGKVEKGIGMLSGIFIILLMLLTDSNIFGRYVLNKPVPGSVEISILLLVILLMISQPWVQSINGHIKLDFIMERLSPKATIYFQIAILVITLIVCALLTWQSARFASRSWEDAFWGVLVIRYWPALIAVPIGFGIVCFRIPVQIYEEIIKLNQLRNKEDNNE